MRAKLIAISILFILLITQISVEAKSFNSFLEPYSDAEQNPLVSSKLASNPIGSYKNIDLENVPVAFTENLGQLENDDVRFYDQSGSVWFTDDGMWMEVRDDSSIISHQSIVNSPDSVLPTNDRRLMTNDYKRIVLKQEFIGANQVQPKGINRLSWDSNFFYGNDSTKWRTNVPNYQEIYYYNLYDGIDLRYYPNTQGLKYDFIVHPGADIGKIRIKYDGAEKLEVNKFNNLVIKTHKKDIIDGDLYIYQNIDNIQQCINGKFVIHNEFEYGFIIMDDYDKQANLVIDPLVKLDYSTYIGGSGSDQGFNIAVDNMGNAYAIGNTWSSNFPVTPGAYKTSWEDVFVLKLNAKGSKLSYATFIGGTYFEYGYGITVDQNGNAYITGKTRSSNFPTTAGAYCTSKSETMSYDVFVSKLNWNGTKLLYSTYLIGTGGFVEARDIITDSMGNAYVTGISESSTFPTTTGVYDPTHNGGTDVFISQLNHNGSVLNYSTFVGGSSQDDGFAIALDSMGNVFVTGYTRSSNFPTTNGAYDTTHNGNFDVFVVKLNHNASILIYSTFVGGTGYDNAVGIDIDSQGNTYVMGETTSQFPVTPGAYNTTRSAQSDVFVFQLNQTGQNLSYSTYLGGNSYDYASGIAVDSLGNALIVGDTKSTDFPITPDAIDTVYSGNHEAFFAKLTPDLSELSYSTYLGGNNVDYSEDITRDMVDNAYLVGYTASSDFPTTPGVHSSNHNGSYDLFMTKFLFRPTINISSLEIILDENPTDIAYTGMGPYTLRVNLIDTVDMTDLNTVGITLDPSGKNIRMTWERSTGQFKKFSDPNNYLILSSTSKANNYFSFWSIDFNFTFNWTYPTEDLQNVRVYATSATLPTAWFNATGFYCVENDLLFNGTLKVTGENNRTIREDTLVRGGEILNWTGLVPVYEGTNDTYPPDEEFNIKIKDESNNIWTNSPTTGEPLFIEMISQNLTDIDGMNFTISIIGIPPECDLTDEIITIRFDGDNVTFSNPIPNNVTWQTNSNVLVGVNITDIGGGEIDGKSVMRSITTNDGINWNDWESIPGLDSKTSMIVQDVITLEEGNGNLVRWQAIDLVGNGPSISDPYRVLVDTEDIAFSNEWPAAQVVSPERNVEFGITISDTTSGVNASSIEFAVSDDKGNSWGPWVPVTGFYDSLKVDAYINYTFSNGSDNRIKWRAFDIAGNGPVESPRYLINVNTWISKPKPNVFLLSPPKDIIINTTSVDTSYSIEGLEDGEIYYWRVLPRIGEQDGTCTSGIWWFKVELEPSINIEDYKISINGVKSVSLYPGENKSVILTITNLGVATDEIELELDAGDLSGLVLLDDYSNLNIESKSYQQRNLEIMLPETFKIGLYVISINAISLGSGKLVRDNHLIAVEVKARSDIPDKPEPNGTDKNDTNGIESDNKPAKGADNILIYSGITIVILIILFIALFAFITKRKKRIEQELLPPGTFAIKPGALPSPVITLDQVPAAPTLATLPSAAETIAQVSPQISTASVPVPQLAKSTQIPHPTVAQPTVQVPQPLPQLPPAQISVPSRETPLTPMSTEAPTLTSQPPTPTPTLAQTPQPQPTLDSSSMTPSPSIVSSQTTQATTPPTPTTTPITPTVSAPQPTVPTPSLAELPATPPGPVVHLPETEPKPSFKPEIEETQTFGQQTSQLQDSTTNNENNIHRPNEKENDNKKNQVEQ
jgi:hypothetical protein